jgi:signal transduction histidine kinase
MPFDRTFWREGLFSLVCLVSALALLYLRPIQFSGLQLWLYLVPILLTLQRVRFAWFVVSMIVLEALAINAAVFFDRYIIETAGALSLVIGVAIGRRWISNDFVMASGIASLLLVSLPLVFILSVYWAGLEQLHAQVVAVRFATSAIVSLLIVESVLVGAAMLDWWILSPFRTADQQRVTLVQIGNYFTSIVFVAALFFGLLLIWQTWLGIARTALSEYVANRSQQLLSTSYITTRTRLQALQNTTVLLAESGRSVSEIHAEVKRQLALFAGQDAEQIQYVISTPGGAVYSQSAQIEVSAQYLIREAQEIIDIRPELVALSLPERGGGYSPTSVLLLEDSWVVLVFGSREVASNFEARASAPNNATATVGDILINQDLAGTSYSIWAEMQVVKDLDLQDAVLRPNGMLEMVVRSSRTDDYRIHLHGAADLKVDYPYWNLYVAYVKVSSWGALVALVLLFLALGLSRYLIAQQVGPLRTLSQVFKTWRTNPAGALGAGSVIHTLEGSSNSSLDEVWSLQENFRELARDVMVGQRRLTTIAANYDELLRSLPLGVLAVDDRHQIQFLNDALGDITEQRQEAIARLKEVATDMISKGKTVTEWQLGLDGRSPKSLLMVVNQRLDEKGQESGWWAIVTDLTEQKQTSAQLVQASKLATLGEMSTGMAHELNQPLNVISLATSNLKFLISKGRASEESTLPKLERIDGAVRRAASIIDHMRAYGRLAGEDLSIIEIYEIVRGACELLGEQLKLTNVELVNEVQSRGLTIRGNAIQLEQVLINLVNNARDAIRDSGNPGKVTVSAEERTGRVLLAVSDTGGGIPADVLPHIFEPFFTTKPVGKGTGLGGSISYGIVRDMQGDMWAENIEGGARITISLPIIRQHTSEPPSTEKQ